MFSCSTPVLDWKVETNLYTCIVVEVCNLSLFIVATLQETTKWHSDLNSSFHPYYDTKSSCKKMIQKAFLSYFILDSYFLCLSFCSSFLWSASFYEVNLLSIVVSNRHMFLQMYCFGCIMVGYVVLLYLIFEWRGWSLLFGAICILALKIGSYALGRAASVTF